MSKAASSISMTLTSETISKMVDFYAEQRLESKNPYIIFFAKTEHCAISIYKTNKVLFQGEGAEIEANIWQHQELQPKKANPKPTSNNQLSPSTKFLEHGGSDEVGTGDYFGPVCVCACVITKEAYQEIQHLGIDDSKNLNDEKIRQIAPIIKDVVPYSLLILPNKKYNEVHKNYNMNAIKALLHNQAYVHLQSKVKQLPAFCVVDQFTPEDSYFRLIQFEETIIRKLHFETKAESKYLAVACASVIARDAFLTAMDQLSVTYDMTLPKGAGTTVDAAIETFVNTHGFDQLKYVAKLHFANTAKVLDNKNM